MIIQVCVSRISPKCVSVMNRLRAEILERVLVPLLDFAPDADGGGLSVEKCTYADEDSHGMSCYVRLLDVSVTPERIPKLVDARQELEDLYARVIAASSSEKPGVVKLGVRIVLDGPVNGSTLVESPASREIMIAGK